MTKQQGGGAEMEAVPDRDAIAAAAALQLTSSQTNPGMH